MAVVYSDDLKDIRMQSVIDAVDAGLEVGTLEISNGIAVLATFVLRKPSFTLGDQQIILAGTPLSVVAPGSGYAVAARFKDGDGNIVIDGLTVGVANADIVLLRSTLNAGETVTITGGTITHG